MSGEILCAPSDRFKFRRQLAIGGAWRRNGGILYDANPLGQRHARRIDNLPAVELINEDLAGTNQRGHAER